MGERIFSIRLPNGRHHRPDLVLLGELPIPIEVELTQKGGQRLDRIITAWGEAVQKDRFAAVRYLCSVEALPYVERSVQRTETGEQVDVELLPEGCMISTWQET